MSYRRAGDDTGDMSQATLFKNEKKVKKPKKHEGIFQSCKWFKANPITNYQFGVMLLFGLLTPVWAVLKLLGSDLTAEVLAGVMGLVLSCHGANYFRILFRLKAEVGRFGASNEAFRSTNSQLIQEVDKLSKASEKLTLVSAGLKQTTQSYQDNIKKFQSIDAKLSKFSADNMEGIKKIQEISKTVKKSISKELIQHQRDILFAVQDKMDLDTVVGLDENEYNNFISALPKSYQVRFKNMNKTFDVLSGPDDIMDYDEFIALADEFALQEAVATGASIKNDDDDDDDDNKDNDQ